ncbi:MAG: class I SAM-dependent methyltransferase [Chloroflexi bacterium]|nr:class I SAM-dependent methyltransferase [Chloroflexota bacterium]
MNSTNTCPLCQSTEQTDFHQDHNRTYSRCTQCNLVFVLPSAYLSPEAEKAEYDLHQNSPDDLQYRKFLSRLFTPIQKQLQPSSFGLDFGSGPGPTLSVMFAEVGHFMAIYDHFYANDPSVFKSQYDFITATEVVEHLHHPARELNRLWCCLKPGGTLGIMTKLVLNQTAFTTWHYKNDQTHVCFFSRTTFRWLANQWKAKLTFIDKDVIILQKSE